MTHRGREAMIIFDLTVLAVSARDFYAHPSGVDDAVATFEYPLGTVQACVDALKDPGDRCLLKSATWTGEAATVKISGKHGNASAPIIIGAAGDGPVIFDGTIPVTSPWKKNSASPGFYTTELNSPVWQLFASPVSSKATLDLQMQIPARWPNARWDDKTMFHGPENWAHAGPVGTGSHNVTTGDGHLHGLLIFKSLAPCSSPHRSHRTCIPDIGACNASSDCCAYCNHNDLAKSGINATNAVAILNMWGDGTGMYVCMCACVHVCVCVCV